MSCWHGDWQRDDGTIADLGDTFQRHVAPALLPPTGSQPVGDLAPLYLGILGVFLREGSSDEGGDDAASILTSMGQRIAGEVDAAPLPGRAEDARDRYLDAFEAVGDDQFHPAPMHPSWPRNML